MISAAEEAFNGKINTMINSNKNETIPPQPRAIHSISSGFSTVSNNLNLVLFPLAINLFLWLGPVLRIKELFTPYVEEWVNFIRLNNANITGYQELIDLVSSISSGYLSVLNIFSAISTLPIGIPGLTTRTDSLMTPFGESKIFEIHSMGQLAGVWLLISVAGIFLGSLFFYEISRVSQEQHHEFSAKTMGKAFINGLSLVIILFLVFLGIGSIILLILSLIAVVSPLIAQLTMFVILFFLVWIIIPILFSFHEIFLYQRQFLQSFINGISLIRFMFPSSSFFVVTAFFLYTGLNILWTIPASDSWFTVIGMVAHAFISTIIITASFDYYQNAKQWLEDIRSIQHNKTTA